jgi:hypothetical protein
MPADRCLAPAPHSTRGSGARSTPTVFCPKPNAPAARNAPARSTTSAWRCGASRPGVGRPQHAAPMVQPERCRTPRRADNERTAPPRARVANACVVDTPTEGRRVQPAAVEHHLSHACRPAESPTACVGGSIVRTTLTAEPLVGELPGDPQGPADVRPRVAVLPAKSARRVAQRGPRSVRAGRPTRATSPCQRR